MEGLAERTMTWSRLPCKTCVTIGIKLAAVVGSCERRQYLSDESVTEESSPRRYSLRDERQRDSCTSAAWLATRDQIGTCPHDFSHMPVMCSGYTHRSKMISSHMRFERPYGFVIPLPPPCWTTHCSSTIPSPSASWP